MTGWLTRLLGGGDEPDPRFTLANERTFLAWVRTALALIAGGVGVEALLAGQMSAPLHTGLASLLVLAGGVTGVGGFRRWLVVERAMRRREPLPPPPLALVTVAVVLAVAVAALLWLITR
jgi:putative membrane protein